MDRSSKHGVEAGMSVATSKDGREWTTRTISQLKYAKSFVIGRQLWLTTDDATVASLDGETWHRMDSKLFPKGAESIVRHDDAWFIRCTGSEQDAQRTIVETQTLWRRRAVTDDEIEAAPTHPSSPYEWLSPGRKYTNAVAEADAAMTAAEKHEDRLAAVERVGNAFRAAIPSVAASSAVDEAEAWYRRLLDYKTDGPTIFIATTTVMSFFDPSDKNRTETKAFLARQPPAIRDYVRKCSDATMQGSALPKLDLKPTSTTPGPQQQAAWFNVRVWREASANGNVGTMIDLMQRAYANGAGAPADQTSPLSFGRIKRGDAATNHRRSGLRPPKRRR
jgi:hypothetical protein